ncbi:hypothetical protein [Xanthomonas phage Carpasina]|uniref:Uncharacterized protein n=1 Tax=Xanthomonas phage Carpasina TaxID=2163636 RepID=A0A2S1GSX9_9CAUD|nr:hypothetical protein HOT16_gp61 [Xanthomonas phage Carpasina]AWD92456.1 hypothetical protein [Xanthomonas phage Carpasina]
MKAPDERSLLTQKFGIIATSTDAPAKRNPEMTVDQLIEKLMAEKNKGRGNLQVRHRDLGNTQKEIYERIDCVDIGEGLNGETIITLD